MESKFKIIEQPRGSIETVDIRDTLQFPLEWNLFQNFYLG